MKQLVPLLFLLACTRGPIDRDVTGNKLGTHNNSKFNPVKKKVALLKIFNESPFGGEDLEITATEELRRELMRTRSFIVDSNATRMFGNSKEIYAGGGSKLHQHARKAKIMGLNFVIFGRIIDARVREKTDEIGVIRTKNAYTESKVEFKVYDVHSGKEILSEVINGYADDKSFKFFMSNRQEDLTYRQELLRYAVRVAVRKVIPRIAAISSKFDWVGRVAKIVATKIYINAGRSSGLNVGDVLRVLSEGEEIFDPETGALLGVSKGETKGTVEIIEYFGQDGAIAILHSGGSVVEGDFVELY
jgi:hypothetical protein